MLLASVLPKNFATPLLKLEHPNILAIKSTTIFWSPQNFQEMDTQKHRSKYFTATKHYWSFCNTLAFYDRRLLKTKVSKEFWTNAFPRWTIFHSVSPLLCKVWMLDINSSIRPKYIYHCSNVFLLRFPSSPPLLGRSNGETTRYVIAYMCVTVMPCDVLPVSLGTVLYCTGLQHI